jgi:hypothetical protein
LGRGVVKFGMKVKMPRPLNVTAMIDELDKGLIQFVTKNITPSFEATTRTWSTKPTWDYYHQRKPSQLTSRVYTSSKIYGYVSGGTRVRYARMTPNFQAKTVANFIGSRAGRGGFLGMSRVPLPGIKARKFDEAIAKRWQPKMQSKLNPFLIKAAKASGHFRR